MGASTRKTARHRKKSRLGHHRARFYSEQSTSTSWLLSEWTAPRLFHAFRICSTCLMTEGQRTLCLRCLQRLQARILCRLEGNNEVPSEWESRSLGIRSEAEGAMVALIGLCRGPRSAGGSGSRCLRGVGESKVRYQGCCQYIYIGVVHPLFPLPSWSWFDNEMVRHW